MNLPYYMLLGAATIFQSETASGYCVAATAHLFDNQH